MDSVCPKYVDEEAEDGHYTPLVSSTDYYNYLHYSLKHNILHTHMFQTYPISTALILKNIDLPLS